jgi:hypothetical protein
MSQMTSPHLNWSELRRTPDDPRPPAALVIGIAFGMLLGWAALVMTFELPVVPGALGAGVIAVAAAWWLTVPASMVAAAVSFLVVDGFVQGRMGELGWDGTTDAVILVALLASCAIAAEVHGTALDQPRHGSGSRDEE